MARTLIKNGTVVSPTGRHEVDVLIEGETILALLERGKSDSLNITADKVIDAKGKYVIPGGIDAHTVAFDEGRERGQRLVSKCVGAVFGQVPQRQAQRAQLADIGRQFIAGDRAGQVYRDQLHILPAGGLQQTLHALAIGKGKLAGCSWCAWG